MSKLLKKEKNNRPKVLNKLFNKNSAGETDKKNWYSDRYQTVLVQRNLLSIFSLIALVFSTIAIFFVYRNIPIVTVEPFVIQVEPKSGITQVVNAQSAYEITAKESINTYFIVRYIQARETVDSALPYHYEVVRLMSDPKWVFGMYNWQVNPDNPDSFVARSGGAGERSVKIRSMIRTDANPNCIDVVCQVQVRITVTEVIRGYSQQKHQIVYMDYTFTNVDLKQYERFVNPIGFRVLSYRVTDEVLQ